MKKFLALVLSLMLVLTLSGCGNPAANDLSGEYRDLSFLYAGIIDDESKSPLVIEKSGDSLSYNDGDYSGNCVLEESILTITPEKGLTERNQGLLELDIKMGKNIDKSFFVDGEFLVDKSSDIDVEIEGTFAEGKWNECDIEIDFSSQSIPTITINDAMIELNADGTCEFEGGFISSGVEFEFYYEGTYEVVGNTVVLEFNLYKEYTDSSEDYKEDGKWSCAIYIEDDMAYTNIYQKIK